LYQGSTGSLQTSIACVWNPPTPNIINVTNTGAGTVTIAGTDSTSQCFLQALGGGYDETNGSPIKVVISRSNAGVWTLTNTNVAYDFTSTAVCVDVPGAYWFMENNWTGDYTVNAFTQTSTAPEVCGLRGIQGLFTSSADSVGVYAPSSLPGHWALHTTNSDTGWITCLQ
jgi:hypothetical protein